MLSLRFNPQIINSLTRRKLLRNKEFCYLTREKYFHNKQDSLPLFEAGGNTIFLFSCFQPFHLAFTNFKTNYPMFSLKKGHLIRIIRMLRFYGTAFFVPGQSRSILTPIIRTPVNVDNGYFFLLQQPQAPDSNQQILRPEEVNLDNMTLCYQPCAVLILASDEVILMFTVLRQTGEDEVDTSISDFLK